MNLIELSNKFPTELSCIEYMEKLRWGKKPKCAYCGSVNLNKRTPDHRHKCKDCNRTSAVTVNTFLHDTRLPIKTWLFAFAIITDAKKGISALQLQRNLNVSYPTAHSMYHKIRTLMGDQNKGIDQLSGIVEMDETFIGGKPRKQSDFGNFTQKKRADLDVKIKELTGEGFVFKGKKPNPAKIDPNPKRGRGTTNIPVAGIVQRDGDVVAQVMQNLSYENLRDMVKKHVKEENSVLITDEYKGYSKMHNIIEHVKIEHKKIYSYRGINTNSIESFWAIIERGIMGQYHSVSLKYLPNYIAEFVYKYNNRKDNEAMFYELIKKSITPLKQRLPISL